MDSSVEIELKTLTSYNASVPTSAAEERAAKPGVNYRKRIDIAVLCVVLVVLWGLLSLPAVFRIVDLTEVYVSLVPRPSTQAPSKSRER